MRCRAPLLFVLLARLTCAQMGHRRFMITSADPGFDGSVPSCVSRVLTLDPLTGRGIR